MERCPLELNGLFTYEKLNIFLLGSYDVLIGMDQLEAHRVKLGCLEKTFDCIDEDGNSRTMRDILKEVFVGQISSLQLKKSFKKGCRTHTSHVLDSIENKGPKLEDQIFVTRIQGCVS